MESEELRVLIRTVSDDRGVTQTQTALRTLGQQGEQANATLRRSGQAARESTEGFRVGREDILRFVSALTGIELGLSIFTSLGQRIHEAFAQAVEGQAENERTVRATAAAYGAAATQFQQFAATLSQETGFTAQAILEAAISARTLSANYGLAIDQTQRLIRVSADLARVRGIGIAESFERVQSAIRGEAEASEFLGLTLNDTFIKNNALNGSVRNTFERMSDAQKAQVRYNEILRQTAQFQGLAAQSARSLDGAMGQASLASANLSLALGRMIEPSVISGLQAATTATLGLQRGLEGVGQAQRLIPQQEILGQLAPELITAIPLLGTSIGLLNLMGAGIDKLAQAERDRQNELRGQAIVTAQLLDAQADVMSQLGSSVAPQRFGESMRIVNEQLVRTHNSLQQLSQDIGELGGRGGNLSSVLGALAEGDTQGRALVQSQQVLQTIDARILANRALLAIEQEVAQLRRSTRISDPRDVAGANAARDRLQLLEQILPIERDLIDTQNAQRQVTEALTQSQREQAQIELSLLPARQEVARLEREINSTQAEGLRLGRERQSLLAQQAAMPAEFALADTRAQVERDRLVLANRRGTTPEERAAARSELRQLQRDVLPAQELAGFDARRRLELVERGGRAADIAEQLRQNELRQRQVQLRGALEPGEARLAALQDQQQVLQLLGRIAEATSSSLQQQLEALIDRTGQPQRIDLRIELTDPAGSVQVFQELVEANTQAQTPPVVQVSAVRRN